MVSYRYMHMSMRGLRDGTSDVSRSNAYDSYMMVPSSMQMDMHMLGVMYAASSRLTLMAMANYLSMNMQSYMMMSMMESKGKTQSSGFGDLRLGGMYKLLDRSGQRLHFNLMVSIPTGSINNKDVTLMSTPDKTQLAYAMQTGTGTWAVLPGFTYLGQSGAISWGAQTMGTIRFGKNDRGYAFGDQVSLLGWGAYRFTPWMSWSLKVKGSTTAAIRGSDDSYSNSMMSPMLNPQNYGGQLLTGGLGANFYVPGGTFKNIRLGLEFETPFYQKTNGLSMKTANTITAGIQYSFK